MPVGRCDIVRAAAAGAFALAPSIALASSPRVPDPDACGPAQPLTAAAASAAAAPPAAEPSAFRTLQSWDFFTNYGNYIPRTHCLQDQNGRPDWPWIAAIIVLTTCIVAAYLKIFVFWRRSYLDEAPHDRNTKLMDLAYVFLWCAVCGYVMSIVMFVWPAYRLLAAFLLVLNFFSWRFAGNLSDLRVSLSAKRLERQLAQEQLGRTVQLEALVTERTRELELAREAAQRAAGFKGQFIANMSHEIRTPLNAITGFLDLAFDHEISEDQRRDHAGTVRRHADHLLALIGDILDNAKIEAGEMRIERLPTDLSRILEDARAVFTARARDQGIALVMRADPALAHPVLTDPGRVRQVLFNLLSNAVKFTQQGEVRIHARFLPAENPHLPPVVSVEVADTGIGISPERIDSIFCPFTQADETMTRRFGGTGLGLSISARLAELLGGSVRVESTPGAGSTFTFEFLAPIAAAAPPAPTGAAGPDAGAARLNNRRILVVDDALDNRRIAAHHLTRAGAAVTQAEHGAQALELVKAAPEPFHVILLDMQMPVMDGYETVRLLKAAACPTPVIALTAHAMAEDRARCIKAGCDDYLSKPFDRHALIDACSRLIEDRLIDAPRDEYHPA